MHELADAIGEYDDHLRSHTPVMQSQAASTDALQSAAVEMRALTASLTQAVLKLSDSHGQS